MSRTLWLSADGRLRTFDQTRLPFEQREITLDSAEACRRAIETMQVRGAPLIGAVGAWGLAFALRDDPSDQALEEAAASLLAARPTAVNLRWALERCLARVRPLAVGRRAQAARDEAMAICDDDEASNRRIGEHGMRLIEALGIVDRPIQLLTHCHAGALATLAYGTALAPIHLLHQRGVPLHVWVDETRPRNQGALTAWELGAHGIAHTIIADNAGGLLMQRGQVDAVIVGCDRVAANGDVANKIGTYLKALAARDAALPFWVACPSSTIDPRAPDGASIPIEERDGAELRRIRGLRSDGSVDTVTVLPETSAVANPAFDVTPARLVSALITEFGSVPATAAGVARALAAAGRSDEGI